MRKPRPMKNRRVRELLADTGGLTTIEYVMLACLIAVVCFGIWRQFGETIKAKVTGADQQLAQLPVTSSVN
jgi:Flp pilus assembly pilin Flp